VEEVHHALIARLMTHIPEPWEQTTRYFGWELVPRTEHAECGIRRIESVVTKRVGERRGRYGLLRTGEGSGPSCCVWSLR